CHRHLGIGADGVVVVESSSVADCKMRIYNPDGSEAKMCGNALRCLYLFLEKINKESQKSYRVETCERLLTISKEGDLVRCQMGNVH
ncbi:diaminopimelate epimerase, partial [Lacticaseibacillus paracasei]